MKILAAIVTGLLIGSFADAQPTFDGFDYSAGSDSGHKVQLITTTKLSMATRLNEITLAKKSIDIEVFLLTDDQAGRVFLKALVDKKQAVPEINIRLHVDQWASASLSQAGINTLQSAGIEVKKYAGATVRGTKVKRHDHRKVWIFDGERALIGGVNIADAHLGFSAKYNMVDREVLIEGPIVQNVTEVFNKIWAESPTLRPCSSDCKLAQWPPVPASYRNAESRFEPVTVHQVKYYSNILRTSNHPSALVSTLNELLRSAQRDITIEARFFVPIHSTWTILYEKLLKHISVSILTTSRRSLPPHEIEVVLPTERSLRPLEHQGATVHFLNGHVPDAEESFTLQSGSAVWGTHAKTYVVDDAVVVGSYNLEPVSSYLNLENFLILQSAELASQFRKSISDRAAAASLN